MFLSHVLGLSFEGVRDSFVASYLFLLCLVFGTQPSFGPTCLLCLHSLDSLSSLFELFPFLCFCLCGFFVMGSGLFLVNSCRHLGIVFP